MDKASHLLQLFFFDELKRVKAFDFGGNGAGETGGIEVGDPVHTAFPGAKIFPDFLAGITHPADQPDPSHHNASLLLQVYLPPFEFLPMYSIASFTVRIFSASSSGISMSKASSNAISNSTVSRESAPRSSTNEAFCVTSPSSPPNCSPMICFTLSSTFLSAIELASP